MNKYSYIKIRLKNKLSEFIGIDFFKRKANYHYVPDIYGKSSYKMRDIRDDKFFYKYSSQVVNNKTTYLYFDRLYIIYQCIKHIRKLFYSDTNIEFVEVGVYKGGSSYFIANIAKHFFNENIFLSCVDTFEGHQEIDLINGLDSDHGQGTFIDTSYETVKNYLSTFNFVQITKGRIQENTEIFNDKKIHFIHLDMDIYEPTIFSLKFFDKILVKNGIILLDDFGFNSCPGVEKAINNFDQSNYFSVAIDTGQFLMIKLN